MPREKQAAAVEDEEEVLELTDAVVVDDNQDDTDADQQAVDQAEVQTGGDEEETVISFGDDEDDQPDDNSTMRHMREKLREKERRIRELESAAPKQQKIEIGEKPTLAGCDYDEERFETELEAFNKRKSDAEAQERAAAQQNEEIQRDWQNDLQGFATKKAKLSATVPDLDELQQTVEGSIDQVQLAVLIKASNDPALLMVALARSPAKLAEIAKMKDPIKLAAAIARIEGGIKVVTKRKGPAIDSPQRGSASTVVPDSDKQLEKLEAEADRTGDRTKVIAFKRKLREQGK